MPCSESYPDSPDEKELKESLDIMKRVFYRIERERNEAVNILCQLGNIYDEQDNATDADVLDLVPDEFWSWWEEHKIRDKKRRFQNENS